jgi:2Fe-2S ferredoxin
MTVVTFIEFDGTEHQVDADPGLSVMELAMKYDVPGIDADCGGGAVCGTCHCFIASDVVLGEIEAQEESMLGLRPDREETSRLGCQVIIAADTPDFTVRLPEFQM